VGACAIFVLAATDAVNEEIQDNEASVVSPGDTGATGADPGGFEGAGSCDAPVAVGTEVALGNGWRVKVVSADLGPDANDKVAAANEFNDPPEAGMRFVIIKLSASYDGRDDTATESPFMGTTYSLFGSASVERSESDSFATAPEPVLDSSAELAAGGVAVGNVVIQVGADETNLVMRMTPGFSFDSTEAWLALG